MRKQESHGHIGEAAVYAKCWMHGIQAHFTGGLKRNFAGSDLLIETAKERHKLWVQVKSGYTKTKGQVYLTQSAGEIDLKVDKFTADFVVFVNIDAKTAAGHDHDGKLGFEHLSFYIVPCREANKIYWESLKATAEKPKKDHTPRKLNNVSVSVPEKEMRKYQDAWSLLRKRQAEP